MIATIVVLFFSVGGQAEARCALDKDWPEKPCFDTSPPLPLSKSEWREFWDGYYDYKGKEWMEQKKSELDKQVSAGTLKDWIESGSSTQDYSNYNVWFYYYVNNMAPAPEGYELEDHDQVILAPLKQIRLGISVKDIKCKDSHSLVVRERDSLPACVKLTSINRLYDLGWAKPIDSSSNPDLPQETIGTFVTLFEGNQDGPLLVQEITQDGVMGENFLDYPVARDTGFPITLHLGDTASNGCTIELTLIRVSGNTATFLKKENHDRPCPICLSEDTVIDTPNGSINIKDLKEGMSVFTQDTSGNRIVGTVLQAGNTQVFTYLTIAHIILDDSRELYVSSGHPTADERLIRQLSVSGSLDGSKIKSVEFETYTGTHTYDILPSGPTGFYWANGILMKSSLK
jgi:hypothetical protein